MNLKSLNPYHQKSLRKRSEEEVGQKRRREQRKNLKNQNLNRLYLTSVNLVEEPADPETDPPQNHLYLTSVNQLGEPADPETDPEANPQRKKKQKLKK